MLFAATQAVTAVTPRVVEINPVIALCFLVTCVGMGVLIGLYSDTFPQR